MTYTAADRSTVAKLNAALVANLIKNVEWAA